MGSDSDWRVMSDASQVLTDFGVAHEVEVVSAHRTPDKLVRYGREARGRGLKVIVAGAGGAAHLPGMLASVTALPLLGVRLIGAGDDAVAERVEAYARELEAQVEEKTRRLKASL